MGKGKRLVGVHVASENADLLKACAERGGLTQSDLCDYLISTVLSDASDADLRAAAELYRERSTAKPGPMPAAERKVLRALDTLTGQGGAYAHALQDVAACAGLLTRDAYGALQALTARGLVKTADLSSAHPGEERTDRWGRPVWAVYYTPEAAQAHEDRLRRRTAPVTGA